MSRQTSFAAKWCHWWAVRGFRAPKPGHGAMFGHWCPHQDHSPLPHATTTSLQMVTSAIDHQLGKDGMAPKGHLHGDRGIKFVWLGSQPPAEVAMESPLWLKDTKVLATAPWAGQAQGAALWSSSSTSQETKSCLMGRGLTRELGYKASSAG